MRTKFKKTLGLFLSFFFVLTSGCFQSDGFKVDSKVIIPTTPDTPSPEIPGEPETPAPPIPEPEEPEEPNPPEPEEPEEPEEPVIPAGFYDWGVKTSQRVYLSGHSLMDNPMGDYLADIAQKQSQDYQWNQHIIIGSPMRVRVNGDTTGSFSGWISSGKDKTGNTSINIINEVRNPMTIGTGNKYNALVVGENHNLLDMMIWEDTLRYLKVYSDFYNSSNPTRVLFYHTWLDINKNNPSIWIAYEKEAQKMWECTVSKINQAYVNESSNIRLLNLPISGALVDLVEKIIAGQIPGFTDASVPARLNKIFVDNVHNTNVGQYYVAILNYIGVHGVKPTSLTLPSGYGDLSLLSDSNVLNALIDHAWSYLHSYYTGPSKAHTMSQCRGYAANFCTNLIAIHANWNNHSQCVEAVQNYAFPDAMPVWFNLPN